MKTELPATPKPQGCTNLKLRQFMRRLGQHYDEQMALVGLKTTQYSLLACVDKLGPLRPGELAAQLKMDASTLTRNLKPMVDAGWLTVAAGSDARSRLVAITAEGRAKRAEAKRYWRKAQDGLNRQLGLKQVAALHDLIDEAMTRLAPETAQAITDVRGA
jgi:DNA-binding MarR family transcriptional regulator